MSALEGKHQIPSPEEAQRQMDEALGIVTDAPPPERGPQQPDQQPRVQPTEQEIVAAEQIANSPEELGRWKGEMSQQISALTGRIRPEIEADLRTKIQEVEVGKPRDVASLRLHLAALTAATQRLRRRSPDAAPRTPALTPEQIEVERTRLLQLAENLKGVFREQAENRVQEIKRIKTPEAFARVEREIRESLGGPQPAQPPQEAPNPFYEWAQYADEDPTHVGRGGMAPPQRLPEPPPSPPGGPIDPHLILGDRPGGERLPDWRDIDERRYVGLTIKPIREVLANERDAQLFGEVLRAINSEDAEAVLMRYNAGNPTREDMDFMTYGAHEYAFRLKLAQDVSAKMTKEEVELLSRRNRDFLNLLTHEGDRATEMVKNCIFHSAMVSPDAVGEMRDIFATLAQDRETFRYKRTEKRRDALAERVGIGSKDYGAVFDLTSREGRRATKDDLERRFHERAGKFRRAIDWAADFRNTGAITLGSSRHAAIRAMMKAEKVAPDIGPTSWVLRRIDENLGHITNFLGPVISNPEMRSLVAQETFSNQNLQPAIEAGPRTFAQVQTLSKDRLSQASIEGRIRQHVQADPQWNTRSPYAQDSILSDMKNTERREHAGGGFWAWLTNIIFGQNWNKAAGSALGRPVHI